METPMPHKYRRRPACFYGLCDAGEMPAVQSVLSPTHVPVKRDGSTHLFLTTAHKMPPSGCSVAIAARAVLRYAALNKNSNG